jgi:hypothetical protein
MRTILIVAALAALVATPVSATASRQLRHAAASLSDNTVPASDLAIRGGKVMGADPDTHVRFELQRDNPYY